MTRQRPRLRQQQQQQPHVVVVAGLAAVSLALLLLVGMAGWTEAQQQTTGFRILSQTQQPDTQINGNVPFAQNLTVFTCSQGTYNFTSENITGGIDTYTFVCPLPIQFMTKQNVWSVPWDVRFTRSIACIAQNPLVYNTSSGQLEPTFSTPPPVIDRSGNFSAVPLASAWGVFTSVLQTVGCSYANSATLGLAGAFGGPCSPSGNGISADEFSAYTNLVSQQFATVETTLKGLQTFDAQATLTIGSLIAGQQAIQTYQYYEILALGNLTQVQANQQQQINQIASETAAGINAIQGEIVQVANNAATLTATFNQFALETDSVFNQTLAQMATNNEAIVSQINNMTLALNTEIRARSIADITTASAINTLSAVMIQGSTDAQFLPTLAGQWRQQKLRMKLNNQVRSDADFRFFTTNLGLPGANNPRALPPNLASFTMDSPLFRYIINYNPTLTVGLPLAALSQMQYSCSSLWLSQNPAPITSWVQLTGTLGPAGCDPTNQTAAGACNCWIKLTEEACQMRNVGGVGPVPTPDALANWIAFNYPFIGNDSASSWCVGAQHALDPIPGLPDGILRGLGDLTLYTAALCQRGINPSAGVPLGYSVFSPYFNTTNFVRFDPSACSPVIIDLMNPQPPRTINILYDLVQAFWIPAVSLQAPATANLSQQIIGGVPYNASFTKRYYDQTLSGPLQTCMVMDMTAFDVSNFVTLYKYTLAQLTATADILKNGVVIASVTADSVTNQHDDVMIPDESYIACIEAECWTQAVYDIAYPDTIPESSPLRRAGGFWYAAYPVLNDDNPPTAVIPVAGNWNLTGWYAFNQPFQFDHISAATTLMNVRIPIVCDTTLHPPRCACNGTVAGSTGTICEFLKWYTVTTGHATNQGEQIGISSATDVATYTTTIPTGPLKTSIGSACPIVTPTNAVDFSTQVFVLQNTLNSLNFMEVTQTGACKVVKDYTIQPLSTVAHVVEFCPIQNPDIPIAITISVDLTGNGFLVPCNTSYLATIDPTNPAVAAPSLVTTFGASEVLRAVTTDQSLITLQNLQIQMTNVIQQLIVGIATTFLTNSFALSNDTSNPLGAFGPILATLQQLSVNTSLTAQASRNYSFSYTPDIQNYSTINQGLLNNALNDNAAAYNATLQLAMDIQQSQIDFTQLQQILLDNAATLNASEISLTAMNTATAAIIAEARSRQNGFDLSIGDILDPFVSFLTGVGNFPGSVVDKAVGLLEDLGGDAASALGGMFSSASGVLVIIIVVVSVLAAVGVAIWLIVRFACKSGVSDPSTADLKAQNLALQTRLAALDGKPLDYGVEEAKATLAKGVPAPSTSAGATATIAKVVTSSARRRPLSDDDAIELTLSDPRPPAAGRPARINGTVPEQDVQPWN